MEQERKPIKITKEFPVGKSFLVYCRDGISNEWGRWGAIVLSLDLVKKEITIKISQDWAGADKRGECYWVETRTISFDDFIIPILDSNKEEA